MRMHRNPIWLIFLAVIAAVAIGYSSFTLYKLYGYYTLTRETSPLSIQWTVKVLSDDEYAVNGAYAFLVEGKTIQGETLFKDETFMNPWAAEASVQKFSGKSWKVWYQPSNLHHSTLQKKFPLKECSSAGVLLALLLYFIWLGFYVTRYQV
jgi:hypothetical protein